MSDLQQSPSGPVSISTYFVFRPEQALARSLQKSLPEGEAVEHRIRLRRDAASWTMDHDRAQ
ncbi:hypothetical protein NLM33_37700 [Bradyrhizobium sp. CCGUVB1N3]|uniref:hypothetical protein n=1 Tax=unclassified Bradyrhizobium TaxID=2631580 RepID=UPI0012EBC0F4|nr:MULTISPECIES: hypothetical protein [unclassified Bradyrhizobium]MCP3475974.1 hypothetical protein [Bradyrhizobium sp. CCGUVB1N3]